MQILIQLKAHGALSGVCTKFFGKQNTWKEAQERCRKKGAHLAHVQNADGNQHLVELIPKGTDTGVWLGYSDAAKKGS